MLVNASGRLDPQEATYIPDSEHHKLVMSLFVSMIGLPVRVCHLPQAVSR